MPADANEGTGTHSWITQSLAPWPFAGATLMKCGPLPPPLPLLSLLSAAGGMVQWWGRCQLPPSTLRRVTERVMSTTRYLLEKKPPTRIVGGDADGMVECPSVAAGGRRAIFIGQRIGKQDSNPVHLNIARSALALALAPAPALMPSVVQRRNRLMVASPPPDRKPERQGVKQEMLSPPCSLRPRASVMI